MGCPRNLPTADRGKGRFKCRMSRRRMRWIIDERQCREGLEVTSVGLSEGTGPCDSATGCDARTYGVGLRWDSARRCCPIPENLGLLTGVLIGLTERRVIID